LYERALKSVTYNTIARSRTEESLLTIARGVSAATGEMFFRFLVEHLARALEADYAFIAELIENNLDRVNTIVVYARGEIVSNFEYDLAHTPCRKVVSQSMCSYPSGVQRLFPEDRLLVDMKVEGYVGTALLDSSGRALGLMVVLYNRPIANPKLAESMLQIFAVRAGAELERRRAEDRLRKSEERWRRVFENSNIGIALTDLDGHFIATNAAYQGMLGYTEDELRALSWLDVTHDDDRKTNWALYRDFLERKQQQLLIEKRYRRRDAQILWVSNDISRVPGGEGTPDFIMALVQDITERKRLQDRLELERGHLRLLLEVNNAVVSNIELRPLFAAITASLRTVIQHEYTSLALYDADSRRLGLHVLDFSKGKGLIQEGMQAPIDDSPAGLAFTTRKPVLVNAVELKQFHSAFVKQLIAEGVRSVCCLPIITPSRILGTLNLASVRDGNFTEADVKLLSQVANQIAIALENALAFREIEELKDKLAKEKLYLEEEIRTEHNFGDIIGTSFALKSVLKQVEIVATTDATVLIFGETGTGKELIARSIHDLSARSVQPFVKVNCAAIPRELIESELFGHEKGAFTGAIARRTGRFELAHRGTLFLDEIGELPLELQPKLLRVLQEQEFERLGSAQTVKTDVRLVAATNRNLVQMVQEQKFRDDLYYRLNVFPITVPPLRDRAGDIPLLVRHLVNKFSRRLNRAIESIPGQAMEALTEHHWPGNVRELQNVIERAVILSTDGMLRVPLPELTSTPRASSAAPSGLRTLEDVERDHILQALRETDWVIGGPEGAAERLGLKRSTLRSRMEKLGISRTQG
jgi:formate hydrogenlyase transcriptional activator